jgi:hypothetical protein
MLRNANPVWVLVSATALFWARAKGAKLTSVITVKYNVFRIESLISPPYVP